MAEVVFLLCAVTSLACALLLLRGFARSRVRLLLWSGLCFVALAVNNVLLVLDKVLLPHGDLSLVRYLTSLVAMVLLVFGLIWDAE